VGQHFYVCVNISPYLHNDTKIIKIEIFQSYDHIYTANFFVESHCRVNNCDSDDKFATKTIYQSSDYLKVSFLLPHILRVWNLSI